MKSSIQRLIMTARQVRQMTPQQRRAAIKKRIGPKATAMVQSLRAAREQRMLEGVERRKGPEAAHLALWRGPAKKRGWNAVLGRMLDLQERLPDQLDSFVETGLRESEDPIILARLSQHPLSAGPLGRAMAAERSARRPEIADRMAGRADYAASFVVASAMTGDDSAMEDAATRVPDIVGETFLQMVESFGQRPSASPDQVEPLLRGLRQSGLRKPCRHRLVIAENFADPQSFVPLLAGAEKVTLIGLDDTFGKAGFDKMLTLPGVGEVVVEHIRSRITRFSAKYVEAHSQTRDAAIEIAALVDRVPGLIGQGDLPHLELAIADHLFFQLLRLRAVEELLADPDFDHVVIATRNHVAGSGFILTLSGIQGLTSDPRVEMMSLSPTVAQRVKFAALLPALLTGPRPPGVAAQWMPPVAELAAQLKRNAQGYARPLPDQPVPLREGKDRAVMMVASRNTAYDFSTAQYVAALSRDFSTAFAVCGGSASTIYSAFQDSDAKTEDTPFHLLRREYALRATSFARWLSAQINLYCAARGAGDRIAHVISCAPGRLVEGVIQSHLLHTLVVDQWFARMAATGNLPDAIALSTVRTPAVSAFAAIARRHGVPSLTLEAHGLNPNYCRYSKIVTDYYGVISEAFRQDADPGFGIGVDRTRVIGTPRILAAAGRPVQEARDDIAEAMGIDFPTRPGGVVSFFSQPSNWQHVARVWELTLRAAIAMDLQVLLKPHPEETPSRRDQYAVLARRIGADDRVQLITDVGPNTLIEASDVVLTGYSAAALDAAVMGRPVICVTAGDAAYPVDQHVIARAPLVHDLAELQQELSVRLGHPDRAEAAYAEFLTAEPQFAEGPDQRLRDYLSDILAGGDLRMSDEIAEHLFLDPPHPTFAV